jgi:signal transduction histidine kinase
VDVRISDEGPGIPGQLRGRIFEPRFTTKPPGRGSGLGLHVARRLMARQGGDVFLVGDADPARLPWAATEFCITVPPPPGVQP